MSNVDPSSMSRRQQMSATYKMAKQTYPRLPLLLLGTFLLAGGLGFAIFNFVLPGAGVIGLVLAIVGGLMFGLLAMVIVFGRRAQSAAYAQMEGTPGGAARALSMLRRGWRTDQLVAFTKQQDMVHRVVGPPGIVLVGEGNPHRLKALLPTRSGATRGSPRRCRSTRSWSAMTRARCRSASWCATSRSWAAT